MCMSTFGDVDCSEVGCSGLCDTGRYADGDLLDGRRRGDWRSESEPTTENDVALGVAVHNLAVLGGRIRRNPNVYNRLHSIDRVPAEGS